MFYIDFTDASDLVFPQLYSLSCRWLLPRELGCASARGVLSEMLGNTSKGPNQNFQNHAVIFNSTQSTQFCWDFDSSLVGNFTGNTSQNGVWKVGVMVLFHYV